MAYTGDGLRVARTRAGLTGDLSSRHTPTLMGPGNRRRTSESTTPRNVSSASQRSQRFAFLDAFRASPATPSIPDDEELLDLDVDQALFPHGVPLDRDSFSPAAFKNLQMNATGALKKFQMAYLYKTQQFEQLEEEFHSQADQKEDADENIHNLKNQLERMAQKAAEQESIMQALMEELNQEKRLRMQLERDSNETLNADLRAAPAPSEASEDLFVERDQQTRYRSRRRSAATTKSDVTEFDTDEESIEETSVFSRSRSPTISTTLSEVSVETYAPPPPVPPKGLTPAPVMQHRPVPKIAHPTSTPNSAVTEVPQLNPLQRLWKGMSASETGSEGRTTNGCRNCQGQATSVAWDTVSLLRDENRGLKQQVSELEEAVEGALDAVNGLKLDF